MVFISTFGLNGIAHAKDTWVLEKVVEVYRHGVRPPTAESRQIIEKATDRLWPVWGTPDGNLTSHGADAVALKGSYVGNYYRKLHFLSDTCPANSEVYIWASPLERTRTTAKVLSASMFPNCNVPVFSEKTKNSSKANDTLFHPTSSGLIRVDKSFAMQQSLQAMGQDPQAYLAQYSADIQLLAKAACLSNQACPLFTQINKKNSNVKQVLKNINTLSNIAETIQLAYSQGLPVDQLSANQHEDIAKLIALQAIKYPVLQDVPYIAQQDSSTLMHQIQIALTQGTNLEQKQDNVPAMNARYLVFVGHDANISQLRTLLHFNWQLGSYPKGNVPPGSSLVFERWLNTATQQRYLHVYFQTQGLDQIRNLQPITNDNPLLKAELQPTETIKTPNGNMLPFNYAMSFITTQIDPSAIIPVKLPVKID